jgi:hypothetical protein
MCMSYFNSCTKCDVRENKMVLWQDSAIYGPFVLMRKTMESTQKKPQKPLFIRGWAAMAAEIGYSPSGLKALVRKQLFPAPARPTYRTVLWDARVPEQWREAVLAGKVTLEDEQQ